MHSIDASAFDLFATAVLSIGTMSKMARIRNLPYDLALNFALQLTL